MFKIIYDENGVELKKPDKKYIIVLPDGSIYEADDFMELAATVIGPTYVDCEWAETSWRMRAEAAKIIGLSVMTMQELELGLDLDDEDLEDENLKETIIIYDERIGKILYSYTDANPDYAIHGTPDLIRIECDKTFIYTLIKIQYITVLEKVDDGNYIEITEKRNLDEEIVEILVPFKEKIENIPLHQRLMDE